SLPIDKQAERIVQLAAVDSEANGKYEDAIKLFLLSKVMNQLSHLMSSQNYDKVLDILINQLSRVVTIKDQHNPERERFVTLGRDIHQRHRQDNFLAGEFPY